MDVDNKTSAGKLFWIRQVWISPLEMQYDARLPKMATRYSIWKEPHMEKRHYEKKKKKGNGGKKKGGYEHKPNQKWIIPAEIKYTLTPSTPSRHILIREEK